MDVYHGNKRCNRRAIVTVRGSSLGRVDRAKAVLREQHGSDLEITMLWLGSNKVALYYVGPSSRGANR